MQNSCPADETVPLHIYLACAATPQDEALLDALENQLSILRRRPEVSLWEKRQIPPGTERGPAIVTQIQQAHLILLLLSPDFFASDECHEEMKLALQRREEGEASVIPLLMRAIAGWHTTAIGQLDPLPADRVPISTRADQEHALYEIAEQLQLQLEGIRQKNRTLSEEK